jgi:hypothetical protein
VVRMMTTMIVAAFLSGIQVMAQQPAPPASRSAQPPTPAQQPPVSRPPAEQMPAPTPTPTETPAAPIAQVASPGGELDRSTATALLGRIEELVNDALLDESSKDKKDKADKTDRAKDKDSKAVGTSGKLESKAGKVTIDRADLNEILAEVALLKTMIRR